MLETAQVRSNSDVERRANGTTETQQSVAAVRAAIEGLDAYVPGRSAASLEGSVGDLPVIKLGSNESAYGPFPGVAELITAQARSVHRYPERGFELAEALAQHWNIAVNRVQIGNGADPIIGWICQAFLDPGDEAVMPAPSFVSYALDTRKSGGDPVQVPLIEGRHDIQRMCEAVTERTKVMFVCNPNNPSGAMVEESELTWLIDNVPERVLIVVDEAYAEYVIDEKFRSATSPAILDRPNIAVLRTFSKMYGLAGLRVGYCLASEEIVAALGRVRHYFDVCDLAHLAAVTSLADSAEVSRRRADNHRVRTVFETTMDQWEIPRFESHTNFVALPVADASSTARSLMDRGIITRPIEQHGDDDLLRVTMGTADQMPRIAEEIGCLLKPRRQVSSAFAFG